MTVLEQMKATAAAENARAHEAWPNWADKSLCGNHGKARSMKLDPDEVIEKREAGWTMARLAAHFSVAESTVRYAIRKMEGKA